MSRSIRALVAVIAVAFALSTVACADVAGPHPACDMQNSNTCH